MITVVSGLPRSGTSMLMKMLAAGGMPIYATEFPLMETPKILGLRNGDTDWLDDCEGKTVKVLEPHRNPLPEGREYRFLWITRNWYAMARSQIKCLEHFDPGPERRLHKLGTDELKRRTAVGLKMIRALGETWCFRFEDILHDSLGQAARILRIMPHLNPYAMSLAVEKRAPACLPEIREYEWGGQWTSTA